MSRASRPAAPATPLKHDVCRRMKIAYLARARIPSRDANSIHVMKMCRAFVEGGHDVRLVTPELPGTEPGVVDIHGYYGVPTDFEVVKLPRADIKGGDLWCAVRMARWCRREGIELAYGRHLVGCWAAALAGIPVVLELHTSTEHFGWLGKRAVAHLLGTSALRRLVVISEALGDCIVASHPLVKSKVVVAHDAADQPAPCAPADIGPGEGLRVGYAGHLYPGKGMEVIARLASLCPFATFHVVGGRPEDIAHWKAALGAVGNVVLHGFVEPARVGQYLKAMDVLLGPFQPQVRILGRLDVGQWMSPLKVFEYMASRRPMVISDLPVLREVVNEGNAIIVPPDDVDQWRAALVRLQDPALRERLAEAAYADFRRSHTWTARAEAVLRGL